VIFGTTCDVLNLNPYNNEFVGVKVKEWVYKVKIIEKTSNHS
jgi:hypothetical protein